MKSMTWLHAVVLDSARKCHGEKMAVVPTMSPQNCFKGSAGTWRAVQAAYLPLILLMVSKMTCGYV